MCNRDFDELGEVKRWCPAQNSFFETTGETDAMNDEGPPPNEKAKEVRKRKVGDSEVADGNAIHTSLTSSRRVRSGVFMTIFAGPERRVNPRLGFLSFGDFDELPENVDLPHHDGHKFTFHRMRNVGRGMPTSQ